MRAVAGTHFLAASILVILACYVPLLPLTLWSLVFDKKRRRGPDFIVSLWARLTLIFFGAKVVVEGVENLPPADEPVLFCPNHCSFLDIFALSGFLPRRFKYVSKIEILRIPLVGWAMGFAKHIAIRRSDRASQLQTLKDAVDCLAEGSSLVTFPEGTRSKDGRLMDFKKGPFAMAARAGRRVVPISIVGTHLYFPSSALFPIAWPRGIRIVCHAPLDAPVAKGEAATLKECYAQVRSSLPSSMQPLDKST